MHQPIRIVTGLPEAKAMGPWPPHDHEEEHMSCSRRLSITVMLLLTVLGWLVPHAAAGSISWAAQPRE
jgi:hypothetical protein